MKTKTTISLTVDISVSNYFKILRTDLNLSNLVNNFLRMYMNTEKENENITELQEEIEKISNKIREDENQRNILFIKLQNAKQEEEIILKEEQEEQEEMKQFLRMNSREILL